MTPAGEATGPVAASTSIVWASTTLARPRWTSTWWRARLAPIRTSRVPRRPRLPDGSASLPASTTQVVSGSLLPVPFVHAPLVVTMDAVAPFFPPASGMCRRRRRATVARRAATNPGAGAADPPGGDPAGGSGAALRGAS